MAQHQITPETKTLFEKGGIEVKIVSEPREIEPSPHTFIVQPTPVTVDYFAYDVPPFEQGSTTPLTVLLDTTRESHKDEATSWSPYTSIEFEIQGHAI
jgi:hypothetical protein